MKLKSNVIIQPLAGETMLVVAATTPDDFHGIVKFNDTAADIASAMKEDVTEDQILALLQEKYEGPEEAMRADIRKVADRLRRIGVLEG